MKGKAAIGPLLIYGLALLTIVVWLFVRNGTPIFDDYDVATHSLGQITGLVGMALFSLSFLLTTRLKLVEDAFGGLDKVYANHHFIGALSFVLLLFHPILLVLKFIPANIPQAAIYLMPSSSWAINFGIIALLGMILLIALTLFVKMKYPNWKTSHKFMGLVFFIAILHIFMVTTDISTYPLLKAFMIFICVIGGTSFAYTTLLKPLIKNRLEYKVGSVQSKGEITVLHLSPVTKKLQFRAGQFAFLKIKDPAVSKESHPFTIASSPLDDTLSFAIKNLGDFTSNINKIKKGALIEVEGPYGRFHETDPKREQVWIAGGIGITPFLSLAEDLAISRRPTSKIDLFYCTRDADEAVFMESFTDASRIVSSLKTIPWFSDTNGRLDAAGVDKKSGVKGKEFFICGPPPMMHALTRQLHALGVPKSRIHMEDFGFK